MAHDKDQDGPVYTKPTQQLDYEARLAAERGELPPEVGKPRSFAVEGNDLSGYAHVEQERMTYANETEKPLIAEDGAEAVFEERARIVAEGSVYSQEAQKETVPDVEVDEAKAGREVTTSEPTSPPPEKNPDAGYSRPSPGGLRSNSKDAKD